MEQGNIFEVATRDKLRFPSERGDLTVEQLWDLPLQTKSGFDLDTVAKTVNAELKATAEESFVSTAPSPQKANLQLKLDVVKYIIAFRLAENARAEQRAKRAAELNRLRELLDKKTDEELGNLGKEELKERIKALESESVPA